MQRKYKLTWFARLTLFILFFLPITFTAVTLIQGDNPIEVIKEKVHFENFIDRDGWKVSEESTVSLEDYESKIVKLESQVDHLETELMMKEAEINALKDVIKKQ